MPKRPLSQAILPEPERANANVIGRCRTEIESRAKAIIRGILIPFVRRKHRLAELGEGFQWDRTGKMAFGPGSRIGRYVYVGNNFDAPGPVVIGDLCMISAGCRIIGDDHEFNIVGMPTRLGFPVTARPVTIFGMDCWVGGDVLIKEGVKLGTGCIVGSGALVTRDVAPYTIVGGVPAKKLRDRFCEADNQQHDSLIRA